MYDVIVIGAGPSGLTRDSILNEIQKVKVYSPFGREISYSHPLPFAYVVDRKNFDNILAKKAMESGAEVKMHTKVMNLAINDKCVNVYALEAETFKIKYLQPDLIMFYKRSLDWDIPKIFFMGSKRK